MANNTLERLTTHLRDRYAVQRELGRGGMATVYLAQDVRHERDVAIKVLHPELAATIGSERFEREIKLAAKLQHQNILGLYDSGDADGLLYYVMPFVEGESLGDRLARDNQLPVEEAVQIALEVAEALGHAHERGVIHRDVKPDNILLAGGHALVADFGIASAAGDAAAGPKLTQTGMALGTPLYMAPEQAMGEKVGPTADIYALGCVLYEMLAGEPPYSAKNASALMARHAMTPVPEIRVVRQAVPEEVQHAIMAAMGKVPADRPQTAAEFVELLGQPFGTTAMRRVARGNTAMHRLPTGTMRARPEPWWRRPAVAMVAVLALVAGFGAWRLTARSETAPGFISSPNARRVAVLYIEDRSPDRRLDFVADGLTEALISSLGSVQGLTVISKSGVAAFRDTDVPLDSVARTLEAGILVKGSIEPDGDRLRVNLDLLDASGASFGDRTSFTQPAGALLAVRDSLAEEASRLIRRRLGDEFRIREQRATTGNVAAWSLVQQADQYRRRGETAARQDRDTVALGTNFRVADSLLAEAERLDPRWVDPVVARAVLDYTRSRLVPRDPLLVRPWVDSGMVHAGQAVALDPNSADALEVRGNLQYWSWLIGLETDKVRARALLEAARDDLVAATQKNSLQAGAWSTLSHLYYNIPGATAIDVNLAALRAWEADAFLSNANVILNRLFLSAYDAGQFAAAEKWCAEMQRRFPDSLDAPRCRLFLLTYPQARTDVPLAWRLADSVTARSPRPDYHRLTSNMLVAAVIARAGLTDSARAVARRNEGDPIMDPTREATQFGAYVHTLLGDNKEALRLLKVYLAANEGRREAFGTDPGWFFRDLKDDPGFRQLFGR